MQEFLCAGSGQQQVQADTHHRDHAVGLGVEFNQDATEFSTVEQDVVRPLQTDTGNSAVLESTRHGDANGQRQARQSCNTASETPQHGKGQAGFRGRPPAPATSAAARRLSVGNQDRSRRRILACPFEQERTGRTAFAQRLDGKSTACPAEQGPQAGGIDLARVKRRVHGFVIRINAAIIADYRCIEPSRSSMVLAPSSPSS
jgi:hypothetical protein